jgi:hypothetical protein
LEVSDGASGIPSAAERALFGPCGQRLQENFIVSADLEVAADSDVVLVHRPDADIVTELPVPGLDTDEAGVELAVIRAGLLWYARVALVSNEKELRAGHLVIVTLV